jgi:hypothetical protein
MSKINFNINPELKKRNRPKNCFWDGSFIRRNEDYFT